MMKPFLIFGGMNTLVAWLGCRRIRQPLGGLFRTTDFSGWKAFQYICIGFALQQLSVVLYAVTKLLHLELPEASFDYFQSTTTISSAQTTRNHARFVQRPRQPKDAKTFCVCPLGNE